MTQLCCGCSHVLLEASGSGRLVSHDDVIVLVIAIGQFVTVTFASCAASS
jgi:hypothetical protein